MKVTGLTCEYRNAWLGTDVSRPRFSWKLEDEKRGTMQKGYQLQVAGADANFNNPLFDTGYSASNKSVLVAYDGPALQSQTRYHYRVKAWDSFGHESEWSTPDWWETALLSHDEWKAAWITPHSDAIDPAAEPAFLLRKAFKLRDRIASARIYSTAAGVYELYVNGEPVGDTVLAPGWTSYKKRLQYQTYDVTVQLHEGANALGIVLANGWYKGRLGWENKTNHYGDRRAALLQLVVRYEDGTSETLVSDTSWKASTGPILFSEIYDGEIYDARLEQDWSDSDFDDRGWGAVETVELPIDILVAQENLPTRVTETIQPAAVIVTPSGDTVLDMGQNMVGRMKFTVEASAGTTITLKHAEVLDRDGNIYFGNLRSANQQITYIAKSEGQETYAAHFSFQGFRYVKVEGYPGQENGLPLDRFVGEIIHTDMQRTGTFECSDTMVNQLQHNIVWGQRGNFLDVPTDCPQRDERLGWTGDAQVFVGTALFNYNGAPFFTKWIRDLEADQLENGGVPFVVPDILSSFSSAAWGDAATIIPWAVYMSFGDKRIIAEQYKSMKAWVDYIRSQGEQEEVWNTGFHFGDWLGLDAKENSYTGATPKHMITAAYFALSARIVHQSAKVLGFEEDAAYYGELADRIAAAFRKEFITPNGRVAAPTQTAHVIALVFDLADQKDRERIAGDLNRLVVENNYHLTTGFVGTPYLCYALSNNGYHETAVRLLLEKTYPSWLYSVSKGATTIWEHWDGIKENGTFWSDDMNSFNHYAYGSVGEWMYRVIAGLAPSEEQPGYKQVRIEPNFTGGRLSHARAAYESMYGLIKSGWAFDGDQVEIRIELPANTTGLIHLRGAKLSDVRENGRLLTETDGILSYEQTEEGVKIEAGSGSYRFEYPRPEDSYVHNVS